MSTDNTNSGRKRKEQTPNDRTVVFYDKQKDELGWASITIIVIGSFIAFVALLVAIFSLANRKVNNAIDEHGYF